MSSGSSVFDKSASFVIGIDVGGTKLRIGAVSGEELCAPCEVFPSSILLQQQSPAEAFSKVITDYLDRHHLRKQELQAVGIGVPATVKADFSTICEAPNLALPGLNQYPLGRKVKQLLHVPVWIEKDVNLLLRRDMRTGEQQGTVLAVYIGTGIGTAVSLNGQVLYGAHGYAMDAGHIPMYGAKGRCGCGKQGCAETLAAGHVLADLREQHFPGTTMETLFLAHRDSEVLKSYVEQCAYVPAVLATVFDPDVLILGGGVIEMAGFPRRNLEEAILGLSGRAVASSGMRFLYAEREEARGVLGAAMFVTERLGEKETGR